MNNNIFDNKISIKIYIIIIVLLITQIILIAHRNSFNKNILYKFYKKETAIKTSIKDKRIISMSDYILKNNITNYKYMKDDLGLVYGNFQEKFRAHVYPIKFIKASKNIITTKLIDKNNCILKHKIAKIRLYECN